MLLKVINKEPLPNLNGVSRVRITFEEVDELLIKPRRSKLIYFEDSSPEMFNLKVNQEVKGAIITREVKPYAFKGRVHNTYTVPVLGVFNTQEEILLSSSKILKKLGVKLPGEQSFVF